MMQIYNVHKCEDNWYFSRGITRSFGENKMIKFNDDTIILSSVMPGNDITDKLPIVGTITVDIKEI